MTKAEELEMLEEFERFRVALHAVGAATDGLYMQQGRSDGIGTPRGVHYRVGRIADGVDEFPLGDTWMYPSRFMESLRVARAALGMVPDSEVPA